MVEAAASGRIGGRVNRLTVPLDEEWKQTTAVILQAEEFPTKKLAIWADARAIIRPVDGNPCLARFFCGRHDIGCVNSPCDEPWLPQCTQPGVPALQYLLWVGSKNLEVATRSELKQCIARATARVNAAEDRAHASPLLQPRDTKIEVTAAEKNMVEI